jgi:hypothetical protein
VADVSTAVDLAGSIKEIKPLPDFVIGARRYADQTRKFAQALFGQSTPQNTVIAMMDFGRVPDGQAVRFQRAKLPEGERALLFSPRANNASAVRRIGWALRRVGIPDLQLAVIHSPFVIEGSRSFGATSPFSHFHTVRTFEEPDLEVDAARIFGGDKFSVVSPADAMALMIGTHTDTIFAE